MEQVRHTLFDIAMDKLESLDARFQKYDEFMQQVLAKTDKQGHEVCIAVEKVINEQGDIRKADEELARRIDAIRDGAHPRESPSDTATHGDAGVAMQLELSDLKAKVLRLTEQSAQHVAQLGVLPTALKGLNSQRIKSCDGDTVYRI